MAYSRIPGIDETYKFPPPVRQGIADSTEVQAKARAIAQEEIALSPIGNEALRYCSLARASDVTLPAGTYVIPWNVTVEDPNDMHNPLTSPTRIVCNLAGLYLVNFSAKITGESNFTKTMLLRKNDVMYFDRAGVPTSEASGTYAQTEVLRLAVGDYITAAVWNAKSGFTLNMETNGVKVTTISLARIGS